MSGPSKRVVTQLAVCYNAMTKKDVKNFIPLPSARKEA